MSFKNVMSQKEIDELVEEFTQTKQELKQKSEAETTGVIASTQAIKEFQAPITKLLTVTPTKLNPVTGKMEVIRDEETGEKVQLSVGDLMHMAVLALVELNVSNDNIEQITANIGLDTISNRQVLFRLGEELELQGADLSDIAKFLGVVQRKMKDEMSEDFDFSDTDSDIKDVQKRMGEKIIDDINSVENQIVSQERLLDELLLQGDSSEVQELTNILDHSKLRLRSLIREFNDIEIEIDQPSESSLTSGELQRAFDETFENIPSRPQLSQSTPSDISQSTPSDISREDTPIPQLGFDPQPHIPQFLEPELEEAFQTGELIEEIREPSSSDVSSAEAERRFKEIQEGITETPFDVSTESTESTEQPFKIDESKGIFDFRPTDNRHTFDFFPNTIFERKVLINRLDGNQSEISVMKISQDGQDIERMGSLLLNNDVVEFLINTPDNRSVTMKFLEDLNTSQQTNIRQLFEVLEWRNYVGFIRETKQNPNSILGAMGSNPGVKFDLVRERLGFGIHTGLGIRTGVGILKPRISLKIGKGQPMRNPYKIDNNGMFGKVRIDVQQLVNFLKLKVFKNNKLVADQIVDKDTFDLLTKRFNVKKQYSESSISVFRDLVSLGELPLTPTSKKFSLLSQKQKRGLEASTMKGEGGGGNKTSKTRKQVNNSNKVEVKMFNNNDELVERMGVIIGSIKAGNNSNIVKSELNQIIDILRTKRIINDDQHKIIFNSYI